MKIICGSRQLLIHGMALVFVGLLWGLIIPHTPFPRLAMGAHIQFEGSGVLYIVVAILLLTLPHRVGRKSIVVMLIGVWLTWIMAFSEVGNAWWGTTEMLPIVAQQGGAKGGTSWQELLVKLAHIAAGLTLIVSWALLMIGFIRKPPAKSQ